MITDYTSLQAAVADWLNRDDLAQVIPDFIQFGENKVYRSLRCALNETQVVVSASTPYFDVPPGYIEAKLITCDGSPLARVSEQRLRIIDDNSGKPSAFSRQGARILIAPHDGGSHDYEVVYWRHFPNLSSNAPVNTLLTYSPAIMLYAALVEACAYLGDDPGVAKWSQALAAEVSSLNQADVEESVSGSTMTVQDLTVSGIN